MKEMLKTLPYWEDLSEDEQRQVEAEAVIRHYEAGEVLYGPTVDCVGMIHVLRGETRAYILSDEGREVTLFHVEAGDNCILSASCVLAYISFESFMVAAKTSDILTVPVRLFGELCEKNVHVRCFAYGLATQRFSTVMYVMQEILFARLDRRLASYLLQVYRKTGETSVRITQEQLALEVNSARETVGRILKHFAEDGMIENRRGSIQLKDIRKLEEAAS